jgi:8-oxo-dGTP diphosphatase
LNEVVEVVAAVIEEAGRILVTRRPAGSHLAGLWEFPGGKADPGEDRVTALRRELREELGVEARVGEAIDTVEWEYPGRRLRLVFFRCAIEGEPRPLEGQEMAWVAARDLDPRDFPPADAELLRKLRQG